MHWNNITRMLFALLTGALTLSPALALATTTLYTFNVPGTLYETASLTQSSSRYLWLAHGGQLPIGSGIGTTPRGTTAFQLFGKSAVTDTTVQADINRVRDNLATANRVPYIGESLIARYTDQNNYYIATLRADGQMAIKRKSGGVYTTLASKKVLPGTYSASGSYDLIPLNTWTTLALSVKDSPSGQPVLTFSADVGKNGRPQQLSTTDTGAALKNAGLVGIQSDYADAQLDNFGYTDSASVPPTPTPTPNPVPAPTPAPIPTSSSNYDSLILSAKPALFLGMNTPASGSEKDLSGHGLTGTYKGGTPGTATLPNGDSVATFNGSSQYLTVPSSSSLSISTTGKLTWEAWIQPDSFDFLHASGDGYVDWMGKCANYSPNCEWEARIYGNSTPQGRTDRLSAYVFNPSAGLGSGADWQPSAKLAAGKWLHVVAEYDMSTTPSGCSSSYPGIITIWVNGVKWDMGSHMPTGCMSQYKISPKAGNSPLNIGTMALDTWFKGAVGKVAVYDHLLTQSEIEAHFTAMTGQTPSGSCGQTCTTASVR